MVFSLGGGSDEKPKSMTELGFLVMSICCSMMVVMGVMRMPFQTPPMLLAACFCTCCCSSSTSTLINDIIIRVKSLNKKDEEDEA